MNCPFDSLHFRMREAPSDPAQAASIDGNDLIELGFTPGPELGHVLRDLLHDVVEEPSENTRDALLRRADEVLKGSHR